MLSDIRVSEYSIFTTNNFLSNLKYIIIFLITYFLGTVLRSVTKALIKQLSLDSSSDQNAYMGEPISSYSLGLSHRVVIKILDESHANQISWKSMISLSPKMQFAFKHKPEICDGTAILSNTQTLKAIKLILYYKSMTKLTKVLTRFQYIIGCSSANLECINEISPSATRIDSSSLRKTSGFK